MAGAEKRAFAKWSNVYKDSAQLQYNPAFIVKIWPIFSTIVSSIGTIVLYYFAIQSKIDVADYVAFSTAYGQISSAIMSLASIATTMAKIKPTLELVSPILDAQPEVNVNKKYLQNFLGILN